MSCVLAVFKYGLRVSNQPGDPVIRMAQKPLSGEILLVGEAVGIFKVPPSIVSAAAFGLAGRTTTAVLPVPLAAVRIKHLPANTAGALTTSHGILTPL